MKNSSACTAALPEEVQTCSRAPLPSHTWLWDFWNGSSAHSPAEKATHQTHDSKLTPCYTEKLFQQILRFRMQFKLSIARILAERLGQAQGNKSYQV